MTAFHLRAPDLTDGMAVNRLIKRCPPLDINSSYCNFLQCEHFANTSVIAEMPVSEGEGEYEGEGAASTPAEVVGFISGYLIPEQTNTLFVWQVAAAEQARGRGLALQMLRHILDRPCCAEVTYLETTITDFNLASWALFERLAQSLSAKITASVWLDKQTHFDGGHDSESLVRIGPFNI